MSEIKTTPILAGAIEDPTYRDFFRDLYGEDEFAALEALRGTTLERGKKKSKTVIILHGIMGSSLGDPNQILDPFDTIWMSIPRIIKGDLIRLKYPDTKKRPIETHGFLPFGYNRFRYTLDKKFRVIEYAYDWRKPLERLGQEFSAFLDKIDDKDVTIVAHSMGGLVTRAALDDTKRKFPNVKKIITLGTPHHGSFSPIMAIRGTNSLLRKLARFIPGQSATDIAEKALATIPGFYDMLPFFGADHLFNAKSWPQSGPRPDQNLLDKARLYQDKIPAIDDRFSLVIGHGSKTIVGAELSRSTDQFEITRSHFGDGAVPFNHAHADNLVRGQVYYSTAEHGALPGNKKVLKAVIDLINDEPVTSLSRQKPKQQERATVSTRLTEKEIINENDIELSQFDDDSPQSLVYAMRDFIRIDEPGEIESVETGEKTGLPSVALEAPAPSPEIDLQALTYYLGGELERRPFELNLFSGDIRDADCRAYAFGIYEGIPPGGAGMVLNRAVDGQINEMFERGMLDARIGGVSILPVARRLVRAEFIVTVGLGLPDGNEDALASATQNLVRYLIKTRAEDCAIVLMGSKSGLSTAESIRGILTGCFRALADEPDSDMFRGLTLCEYDPETFLELQKCASSMAREAAEKISDIRLTLHQKTVIGTEAAVSRRALVSEPSEEKYESSVFITAKLNKFSAKEYELNLNMLGDDALASTQEISHFFSVDTFNKLTKSIREGTPPKPRSNMLKIGNDLADLIFTDEVREIFNQIGRKPIIVQQNPLATRIPWEIIPTQPAGLFPCLEGGLSRHLLIQADSVSKHMNQRRHSDTPLSVLIIGDPTSDLGGADREAQMIYEALRDIVGDRYIEFLRQKDATKSNILKALRSGQYDMLHYAGHAAYEENERWRSGIKCAGGEILTGRDLAQLSQLPAVMVFNACESARVRKAQRKQNSDFQGSFAEAAIMAGISHYVGTYWQVNDLDAVSFAKTFYEEMSEGEMIGNALVKARKSVQERDPSTVDWLNYIHYGNRLFRMKIKGETLSID